MTLEVEIISAIPYHDEYRQGRALYIVGLIFSDILMNAFSEDRIPDIKVLCVVGLIFKIME
jgi:hypothetical protein